MQNGETKLVLPPAQSIDASVVIVSYNTRDVTCRCVQSVLASCDATVQVIVVDNCSSDGSAMELRARFPQITVIDSPANGGFAFGNNIGFEHAVGRYVLVLNPDAEVEPDTIARARDYCDARPEVGVMGCRVRFEDGTRQSSIFRYLSLRQLLGILLMSSAAARRSRLFGDLRYSRLDLDQENDVDSVTGCFMFVRRAMLAQVGGMDQRFFMYGEESEWCRRITRAGWKVRYNPALQIMHVGGASTDGMSAWKAVEITRGHILFLRFTRGAFIAWVGTLLMVLRDLRGAPWRLAKELLVARAAERNERLAWRARLHFVVRALFRLPMGQSISRTNHP